MAENEDVVKAEWYNAITVKVNEIVIEKTSQESINRIRFKTDIGDITYKPRKSVTETEEIAGFKTETVAKKLFTMGEFVKENPMLNELNKNCSNEPQVLVVSYGQITNIDDHNEERKYRYMRDFQWNEIYYATYHKSEENLQKQIERKQKYA